MDASQVDAAPIDVTFRRLVDDDLPMLHRWLQNPGVVRWWEGDDVSWDAVVDHDGSGSADPVEHWVAAVDGRPVGWIQCDAAADDPAEAEAWWTLGVDRSAAGIDDLIGAPADRGRGLGAGMLRAFVAEVVFGGHPGWTQACAAPYAANEASWRALSRAGFRCVGVVDDDDGPCNLMVVDRPAGGEPPGQPGPTTSPGASHGPSQGPSQGPSRGPSPSASP